MNVFSIESEIFLRRHPIMPNKDVNNIIIDMLLKMRKEEIAKEMGKIVYQFPEFGEEYPRKFLRCNNRRYEVAPRGSDRLPIKKMCEDIIKNEDQSVTIRYCMPKYEFPLSKNELNFYENNGWKIKMCEAIESEHNKRFNVFDGYDSGEEIDLVCTFNSV